MGIGLQTLSSRLLYSRGPAVRVKKAGYGGAQPAATGQNQRTFG
jgi:hypothetical protein